MATAPYEVGNVYSSDFSALPTDKSTATAKAEGGWDLNDNAGLADSASGNGNAFCPSDAPGTATSTGKKSSVYYFQPAKLMCTGIYHVNYDVYAGTNVKFANVYFHSKQNTKDQGKAVYNNNSVGKLIDGGAGISRINKGEWYNIDMIRLIIPAFQTAQETDIPTVCSCGTRVTPLKIQRLAKL